MFFNQPGCFHTAGFDENEQEIIRLKNLFQENMLKVEKENMEIIKKNISNIKMEKEENKPKRITTSVENNKSSVYKRLHRKLSENKKEPKLSLSNLQTETVCQNTRSECKNSAIHFLNHFQSSFISSKIQESDSLPTGQYMPCAVPLAPPTQKRSPVSQEMLQQNNVKSRLSQNTAIHHITSEDIPKKLTVQVLPSITIQGAKPNHQINFSNILTEEIKKKDYFEGDGIKTTILPKVSEEERKRISSIKLNSRNFAKNSPSNEKSQLSEVISDKLSAFTQTSCESLVVPDWATEKERLRRIVEEILQDFSFRCHSDHMQINSNSSTVKEHKVISPENDCELDSFLGNVDSFPRLPSTVLNDKTPDISAQTQTSQNIPSAEFNKEQMKDLIQEVISNLQENETLKLCFQSNETFGQNVQQVHKEIQTDVKFSEVAENDRCFVPKAIQVSLKEEPSAKCGSAIVETLKNNQEDATNNLLNNIVHKPSEDITKCDLVSKPLEDSSKLESILNCIYERFCVERVTTPSESILATSKEAAPLVTTREVSVQFNPISTLTKATCTSEVTKADANQQCTLLAPVMLPEKHISHAFVQVALQSNPIPPTTTSTCVQCEQPALMNSYSQTMEYLLVQPPSEHSANTSVSTTPVSDSIFLDDILSEGEVYLPCNLRLLSGPDKTSIRNSRNDTERSGNSDKDNDYSLSEGEIHPKYLQHMNLASSGDSHINYSNPKSIHPLHSTLIAKSSGEVKPESRSHSVAERSLYSSSSLSEGETRNCSTPLSEGEIPFYARQFSPRPSTSQSLNTWNNAMQNPAFCYPFSSHRSDFSLESDSRMHYHLGVYHDEPIRQVNEASLHSVAEEK